MNKKQKDETIEVFAEAFHEVVVPVLEDLKKGLEARIDKLDDRVEMMNRALRVTDHQAEKIDDHEKRIGEIERTIGG